jgi:hypothetical protein
VPEPRIPATIAVPETLATTDSTEPPTGTAETNIIIDTITEPRRSTHMPRVYVSEGIIASNDETLPAWALLVMGSLTDPDPTSYAEALLRLWLRNGERPTPQSSTVSASMLTT